MSYSNLLFFESPLECSETEHFFNRLGLASFSEGFPDKKLLNGLKKGFKCSREEQQVKTINGINLVNLIGC